ncbi:MAG: molybdenum cofactor biosynthesis protein MoaE [Ilumatobacteraceae bacterium]
MQPPTEQSDWLAISDSVLPVGAAHDWCVLPSCGAVVVFSGTVRDHAVDDDGVMRDQVQHLVYEAYDEQAIAAFARIATETRRRWPSVGRIALLHRTGRLELGECSVVAAVSAAHRPEAFEAARYAIDALKASAPIWKHETWGDGAGPRSAWGSRAHDLVDPSAVPTVRGS